MSPRTMKNKSIRRPLLLRLLVAFMALSLVGLIGTGCDEDITVVNDGANASQENQSQNQSQNQTNNHSHNQHNHEEDESHGPDDNEELLDAGLLNGSWRAAMADDDRPIAYFDILHDDGETTATGHFMMGMAPYEHLDETTGDLSDVTIDGNSVEVAWNPTVQLEEMYWVELTRETNDRFTGVLKIEQAPEVEHQVVMERMVFDDFE